MSFLSLSIVLALALPASLWSQQSGLTRAFDLERRGDYAAAAEAYRAVLAARPADVSALLGLERSLLPLSRSAEMLGAVEAAVKAAPTSSTIYGIALRAWAAANQPDSVRSLAERWARMAPTEETPYREWGTAELGRQRAQDDDRPQPGSPRLTVRPGTAWFRLGWILRPAQLYPNGAPVAIRRVSAPSATVTGPSYPAGLRPVSARYAGPDQFVTVVPLGRRGGDRVAEVRR